MPEYRNPGDALRGDKITVQAFKIDPIRVMQRSGSHKGHFTTLRKNAYCVIDIPLRAVLDKIKKPEKR